MSRIAKEKVKDTIRSYYQPKGKEAEVLKMVYDRYQKMKDNPDRIRTMQMIDKWERQWESWREERSALHKEDWQSNHRVPLTTAIVESALAEMIDQTPRPLIL